MHELNVKGNRLLFLDLRNQTQLETASLSGQKSKRPFVRLKKFSLLNFFIDFLDEIESMLTGNELAANVTSIVEVDENGVEVQRPTEYENGKAKFENTPTKSIRYIYNTGANFKPSSVALADDDKKTEMDVTLSEGQEGQEDDEPVSVGGSGGGCEVVLGLWSLAALTIFAKKRS